MGARVIRAVREGDLAALVELYRHLHPSDGPLPRGPELDRLWQTFLTQPGLTCLVAEVNGSLVASCCVAIIPNLTREGRPYALVENVVTHRDHRRRGLATAVLEAALARAWGAGCYKAMLLSGSSREAAHRLYERCGFRADDKRGYVARPGAKA
jgi:ribosomal protein S18 acetylase RimI-like enzyme